MMPLRKYKNSDEMRTVTVPWIYMFIVIDFMYIYCNLLQVASAGSSSNNIRSTGNKQRECAQVRDLKNFNFEHINEAGYGLSSEGYYFCSRSAPTDYMCKCNIAFVCKEFLDPWGRDIGMCGCCATWLYTILAVFLGIVILVGFIVLFVCLFHGSWIYDGYPPPVAPMLPKRSAAIVAPANFPLPPNVFKGYKSSDFISGDLPATMTMGAQDPSMSENSSSTSSSSSPTGPRPLVPQTSITQNNNITSAVDELSTNTNLRRRNVLTSAPSLIPSLPVEPTSTDGNLLPIYSNVSSPQTSNLNPISSSGFIFDMDSNSIPTHR